MSQPLDAIAGQHISGAWLEACGEEGVSAGSGDWCAHSATSWGLPSRGVRRRSKGAAPALLVCQLAPQALSILVQACCPAERISTPDTPLLPASCRVGTACEHERQCVASSPINLHHRD
jgi:hypothetical protein